MDVGCDEGLEEVFLKVREFSKSDGRRFAPISGNTPPYRDERRKGGAPGVSAKMGVYSLAGSASSPIFRLNLHPTGPHEPNGRRLMITPGNELLDNNYTPHCPLKYEGRKIINLACCLT